MPGIKLADNFGGGAAILRPCFYRGIGRYNEWDSDTQDQAAGEVLAER